MAYILTYEMVYLSAFIVCTQLQHLYHHHHHHHTTPIAMTMSTSNTLNALYSEKPDANLNGRLTNVFERSSSILARTISGPSSDTERFCACYRIEIEWDAIFAPIGGTESEGTTG